MTALQPAEARPPMTGGPEDASTASPASPALVAYLRAMRSHPLVILVAVTAAVIGSAPFVLKPPSYEATTQILVSPIPPTDRSYIGLPLPRGLGDPARSANTGAQIVDSPAAAAATARELGGDETATSVAAAIEVTVKENSNIVEVTAANDSPERAAELANSYATAALDVRRGQLEPLIAAQLAATERELARLPNNTDAAASLLQTRIADMRSIADGRDPTLSIIQRAETPQAPGGLPRSTGLAIAVGCGLIIGIVASLLVELLVSPRLRGQSDLVRAYPLPLLARVPLVRRPWGRRPNPISDPPLGVSEAFRALRTQLEIRRERSKNASGPGTVVVITGSPRGIGRTTTAILLARTLARAQNTVLLIDADLRSPGLARALGVTPSEHIASAFGEPDRLRKALTPISVGLDLLAAPDRPDPDLAELVSAHIPRLLERARELADWVVVDGPPLAEAGELIPLAAAADQLLLASRVGMTHQLDLGSVRDLFETVRVEPTGHVLIGDPRRGGAGNLVPRVRSADWQPAGPPAPASRS